MNVDDFRRALLKDAAEEQEKQLEAKRKQLEADKLKREADEFIRRMTARQERKNVKLLRESRERQRLCKELIRRQGPLPPRLNDLIVPSLIVPLPSEVNEPGRDKYGEIHDLYYSVQVPSPIGFDSPSNKEVEQRIMDELALEGFNVARGDLHFESDTDFRTFLKTVRVNQRTRWTPLFESTVAITLIVDGAAKKMVVCPFCHKAIEPAHIKVDETYHNGQPLHYCMNGKHYVDADAACFNKMLEYAYNPRTSLWHLTKVDDPWTKFNDFWKKTYSTESSFWDVWAGDTTVASSDYVKGASYEFPTEFMCSPPAP